MAARRQQEADDEDIIDIDDDDDDDEDEDEDEEYESDFVEKSPQAVAKTVPVTQRQIDLSKKPPPLAEKSITISPLQLDVANFRITSYMPLSSCVFNVTIRLTKEKGRGVFCEEKVIPKGSFICEYVGEVVSAAVCEKRERELEEEGVSESYMYFFEHNKVKYCIDATKETASYGYGRLFNHSFLRPNMFMKKLVINDDPRLALFTLRDINRGEELVYDYGDRRQDSPWLRNT